MARTPRRKKSGRLLLVLLLPFLLLIGAAMSIAGGGAASAAASCQVVANGTVSGAGSGGAAGALTPLQVEQYWVGAGGPLNGAVTAAALSDAESADITDRIQGSSVSTPTQPGPSTPSDASLVGYGLWQITPGSPADYDPTENAKIAVEKYEGSLAAGGGGWSPWTTYGTAAYLAAIPAAQAAFTQLTAASGTGVSAGATGATTTGTTATTTTTPTDTTPTITTGAADQYITRLDGNTDAQYAIVEPDGQVLAQHEDNTPVNGGLITKAMLLVAYLRLHPTADPTGVAARDLKDMIETSNVGDANWAYGQVGPAAVNQVATAAHMTGFHLDTWANGYALSQSTVTAKDLALFFANVDTLIPAAVSKYGMGLLDGIAAANSWGLLDASINGITGSAAGGISETAGYTVNQVAQVTTPQFGTVGIAVTSTANGSLSSGENVIQNIGTDLLSTPTADNLGYGIDLSGLSADEQNELYNSAASMQAQGDSSQCTNVSVSTALPTVPGQVATIETATGLAAAPTGLPADISTTIDKLIAAGNQIHTLPYIWGGGHGVPLEQIQAGYDCSGSTSYLLFKAGLLSSDEAMVSGDYSKWGAPGPGKYVTIFSNAAHVFIEVDGIVMDTAWYSSVTPTSPGSGPRWQPSSMIQAQVNGDIGSGNGGFTETHPVGL
jgi:hypothetical protein